MIDQTVGKRQVIGLLLGPALFGVLLFIPQPHGMSPEALKVGAVAALMATWWITEAIPIPATALLPIALLPTLGVMESGDVTSAYGHHLIYLFMGGFLIAVTMEKWGLHKRIALQTIRFVGTSPDRIVLGFMVATAFLSMWISNTATTMMMVPIAMAVIAQAGEMLERENGSSTNVNPGQFRFATALMLGIAYAASIGGVATLIGTPPNAILVGVIEKTYGQTISFAQWFVFGLPLALVLLVVAWFYLTRWAFRIDVKSLPGGREFITSQIHALGKMSREEKWIVVVATTVACAWITRGVMRIDALRMVHDATIAIGGALLLFIIPSDLKRGRFLLDWRTALKIPWDIIILFGGGFALAQGFAQTGLTQWLATELAIMQGANVAAIVTAVALLAIFLTEVTSNTATATLFLPLMAALSQALDMHPYALMVAAAIATSYAFMLPVATPPNAIVFGSRYVTIVQMVKAGFWLNIIACVLIVVFVTAILPVLWDFQISGFPDAFSRAN